jgi:hypothetical protein
MTSRPFVGARLVPTRSNGIPNLEQQTISRCVPVFRPPREGRSRGVSPVSHGDIGTGVTVGDAASAAPDTENG